MKRGHFSADGTCQACSRSEIILLAVLLCLSVFVRLIQISQPFMDAWSWRQADDAMIARNFYGHGYDIFYPQIDWAGSLPGYVGTEFPLVTFVAALLYPLFGVREWVGRSISVLFFAASVPLFYLFVKKVFNERSAFCAVAIYACTPLTVFAARSFMPDMASLGLSIWGLYLFSVWLQHPTDTKLMLGGSLATGLAILVKLPAVIIGLPFAYMAWKQDGSRFLRNRGLWLVAVLCLFFPFCWYSHAYLISLSYAPYMFFGEGGLRLHSIEVPYISILRRFATVGITPLAFVAAVVGAILPCRTKFGHVFHWWLLAMVLFIFLAGSGNRHPWYQLPAVPIAAALAGAACDFISRRLTSNASLVLGLIFFGGLAYLSDTYVRPLYHPWAAPLVAAGREVGEIAPEAALVVVADEGDSSALYYSGHRGWHFLPNLGARPSDSQQAIAELERLKREGARYLVFTQYSCWWLSYYKQFAAYLQARYPRISETREYVIFDLGHDRIRR